MIAYVNVDNFIRNVDRKSEAFCVSSANSVTFDPNQTRCLAGIANYKQIIILYLPIKLVSF